MIIKVGDEFLDFDGDIEIEKQGKLIDSLDNVSGDYSYEFDIPSTTKNLSILKIQHQNQDKIIFKNVNAVILTDTGTEIYSGFLRVGACYDKIIQCTFFSGNTNWISKITSKLSDLDFSEFDVDYTLDTIIDTWNNGADNGIVFPLVDKGNFADRLANVWVKNDVDYSFFSQNDFQPFVFIKDVMKKIFAFHDLKIEGELFSDALYNDLVITTTNSKTAERIKERTTYAGKTSTQTISSGSFTKITFVDNVDPYSDGSKNLWDNSTSRYTADVRELVLFEFLFRFNISSDTQQYDVNVNVNGSTVFTNNFYWDNHVASSGAILNPGDYLEIEVKPHSSSTNVLAGSYFKITPQKFYTAYYSDYVPEWSSIQLISNVFRIFNVIPCYDPYTKTVTCNLMKDLKYKTPIDISDYIDYSSPENRFDYIEFVSDYGKVTSLKYSESSEQSVKDYNSANVTKFGNGFISIDNDYINATQDLFTLDFCASKNYVNNISQISLLKLNKVSETLSESKDINSVTDDSGDAKFNFTSPPPSPLAIGDVVRITDADLNYQGTGVISFQSVGEFKLEGVTYRGPITSASFQVVTYDESTQSDVIIAIHKKSISVSDISPYSDITIIGGNPRNTFTISTVSYAYFSRNNQPSLNINKLKYGLSFGPLNDDTFYQLDLLDQYYTDVENILNDPIKAYYILNIPERVFVNTSVLYPLKVVNKEIAGLFYFNRITGYKSSDKPCIFELIKIY